MRGILFLYETAQAAENGFIKCLQNVEVYSAVKHRNNSGEVIVVDSFFLPPLFQMTGPLAALLRPAPDKRKKRKWSVSPLWSSLREPERVRRLNMRWVMSRGWWLGWEKSVLLIIGENDTFYYKPWSTFLIIQCIDIAVIRFVITKDVLKCNFIC